MQRFATVAHLCHAAYIYNLRLFVFRLGEHCVTHVLCGADIRAIGGLRPIVCCGRHHSAYMQHNVCAGHTFDHIIVACQVTPYDRQSGILSHERLEHGFVLLARAGKNAYVVTLGITEKLHHSGVAHRAGAACEEYCFFHIYCSCSDDLFFLLTVLNCLFSLIFFHVRTIYSRVLAIISLAGKRCSSACSSSL